ncbi:MAG: hypothetical protein IJU35_09165 [Paludibacteraceae bacterium]|nr:hypothetical protein [Paludibacteraceae bacterium]
MAKKKAGERFPFDKDEELLQINSPRHRVGGPWCVVYRDKKQRWAIVALDWDKKPALGIRWFYGKSGTPISSSYATWFIIPELIHQAILKKVNASQYVYHYLSGKISGKELQKLM